MFCGSAKVPLPMIDPTTSATSRPSPSVPGARAIADATGGARVSVAFEVVTVMFSRVVP